MSEDIHKILHDRHQKALAEVDDFFGPKSADENSGETSGHAIEIKKFEQKDIETSAELAMAFRNNLMNKLQGNLNFEKLRKKYQESFIEGEIVKFLDELIAQEEIATNNRDEFLEEVYIVMVNMIEKADEKDNDISNDYSDGLFFGKNVDLIGKHDFVNELMDGTEDIGILYDDNDLKTTISNIINMYGSSLDCREMLKEGLARNRFRLRVGARYYHESPEQEDEIAAEKFVSKYWLEIEKQIKQQVK